MTRLTELESLDISGTNLGGSDGDKVVTGEVEVQAVEGDHVVQVPPVVVKTYKLYIHNIQFCTEDIVIEVRTSLKYIQGTFLKFTTKRNILQTFTTGETRKSVSWK